MPNYIVTSLGFIKSKKHVEKGVYEITYTTKLREAMSFGKKSAEKFLRENNIIGWLYNPYK